LRFKGKGLFLQTMSKGRDKELISARDRKLFERYYYWTEVKRLRFDDALQKLSSEEFFISEGRIMQIIRKMIREGATVGGSELPAVGFSGFRVTPKAKCDVQQLSLFP
jgi:hypothetical protein